MQRFIEKLIFRLKHRQISCKEALRIVFLAYDKKGVNAFKKEIEVQIIREESLAA